MNERCERAIANARAAWQAYELVPRGPTRDRAQRAYNAARRGMRSVLFSALVPRGEINRIEREIEGSDY